MKLSFPQFQEVVGVFVGGCIERGVGSSFRRKAHAHSSKGDSYVGWICVRSQKRVGVYVMNASNLFDGEITKPSMLMRHEAAHIVTGHGHDDVWRKKLREIGGRINYWETKKYFQQRRRRLHTWVYHRREGDGTWSVCHHGGNPHYKWELNTVQPPAPEETLL